METDEIKSKIKNLFGENCPYNVTNYGKMIRSKIGLLILKSLNYNIQSSDINIMTVTELIHTASLFHDDVIDNDTIRRDPDIDNQTAVLYGNIMLTNAITLLLKLNNPNIIYTFNHTIKKMCEGELLQKSQTGTIPSLEEYLKKTELKTACLFMAEIKALTLNTKTDLAVAEKLTEFGRLFGVAFQIKNDLENVLSDKTDIKNGIYTAPFVLTGKKELTDTAIEKTVGLLDNYIKKAKDCLSILNDSSYKDALIGETECLKK